MASNYSQINLGIKTNVDLSSIQKLKAELQQVRAIADNADFGFNAQSINDIIHSANTLENALTSAFDVDLNTINIEKFNKYIKQSGLSLSQIQKDLASTGPVGQQAFLTATSSLLKMNTALKQTNKFLDDIATSFGNTVRWSIMSGIVNNISSTIQQSYYYVKDLDSSLNDIRIVTGKSADEMERFAVEANNAAKALAVSTKDYTEGSLIYYQQGLDDKTVKTLTDITAMTSNVTGQSMETVSEQLTAVWNGYQVANQAAKEGMGVYQEYVDKMAAVGAATASDLEELATAMSKVASAANAMGVDFDQLSAQIATIVSVTRQAPESVGTALKTIYARIGDLKVDGVDEFGTTLGEVSSNLAKVGVEVVDTNGEMRDIGQVMEEVAAKWDTWNESQQQAIAISIAGKRQYNNLLALFENWDMYTDTLDTAANAAGTLNKQQEIALESINNKMDILKATAEDLYDNLFDEESIKDIIDALTVLLQSVADVTDALGGLETILPMLGGIGVKVFSKQISGSLTTFLTNIKISNQEIANMERTMEQVQTLFSNSSLFDVQNAGSQAAADSLKDITEFYNYFSQSQQSMTQAQKEEYNQILQQKVALGEKKIQLEEEQTIWKNINSHLKLFDAQIIDMPSGLENISGELNKINQLVRRINDQSIRTDIESNDINGATKQLVSYLHTLDLSRDSIKKITERFRELINNGRNVNEALEVIGNELNELGQQSSNVRNLTQDTKILGETTKKAGQDFKESFDLDSAIRNVTGMIGGLSQLASGLSMIKNLADIWNDDTLSSWEKFLQITINLTMTLPMIGNGISSITKGWKSLPTVINNLAVAIGGLSGAEATAALATKGLGASLKGLWSVLSPILAAAGPYIAIIAALGVTVWGVVKAYNAEADAAKAAAEAEEELKNQLEETKTAYNELINTIEDYNDAQQAISELKEGTEEWASAIKDANQQVLSLIETYPELAKYVKTLENGQLILDDSDGGISEFLNNEQKKVGKAERASYAASIIANNKQNISDVTNFGRSMGYGALSQEEIQPVLDAINNNSKEWAEAIKGFNSNSEETQSQAVQTVMDMLGHTSNMLSIDLLKNADALYTLSNSIDANTAANDLLREQNAKSYLEDSKYADKYINSEYKTQLSNLIADKSKSLEDKKLKEYEAMLDDDIHNAYAKYKGLTEIAGLNIGTGSFVDAEGNKYEFNDEQMRAELAANAALEEASNSFDSYYNSLVSLTEEGINAGINKGLSMTESHETGQLLANFLGGEGDLSMATEEQVNALQQAVSKGFTIDSAALKDAGYNSTEEFTAAIQEKINEYRNSGRGAEVAKLLEDQASAEYQEALSETAKELDVSKEALEGYTEALMANNEGLEENAEAAVAAAESNISFAKGAEKLQKALDDNLDILKTWDDTAFETFEAAGQVQEALKEMFGVDVSANFVKENLEDIQKVLKGDEEAINDLALATAQDFVIGLHLDETGTNALQTAIETLNNSDISIGAEVDLGNSINEINRLLEAGELTADQVNQAFGAIGYKPNIEYKKEWGPETETTSTTTIPFLGIDVTTKSTSQSQIAVPYITSSTTGSEGEIGTGIGATNSGSSATKISNSGFRADSIEDLVSKNNKKDASKKKKLEDEVDRYWELNKALEAVTETISDLDKRQSHLHGKELINSLKQENELLEEQANRYKAINAEQMREADELRQKLASTYAVSFDANGGIANYAEATTRMLNWYNNNLNDEVAQESYENFKKLLERYETLYYEEMVDVQNQLDDIFYQQLENNLKAWETDLEINLELEEAEREWSDFTKAMQDDFKKVYRDINRDFANIMEKMSSYGDDGTINLDIQAIQDVVREIEKLEAGGMSDMFVSISEAQEKLKELQGTLMDDAEAAHDLWVEAWEAYLEGIDQAADKFDDLMDKFDNINEELEYQKELVELLYGDEAYDIYAKLYDSQLNNSMTQIKSIKDQIALWQEFYDNAEEGSEEQLKYYELLQDAQSELNDLKLSHIKLLQEERNNTVNQAMDALDKSLTGGLGIDKMKEQWEDAKWYTDRYLDDVEKIYSLESLANDFNKAIINAGTLEQQQELKKLQEQELAILQAKAHTTEYDYEFARKKLAIKEAEIALENAQNAKDSMKLVRGANGNWEYQYVTDEEDVLDKQQQLLDSYQALYDLAQNAKEKAMETAMDLREQMVAEAKQLAIEYQGDQEGLQKALEELYDEYYNPDNGKISLIMGDYTQYEKDLNQSLEIAINGSYENIKTGLENVTRENLGTWTEATQNMADAWNADDGESVRSQVLQAMEDILQANQDYEDKVNELAGVVEEDFSEDGIKGAIDDATDATNDLENATSDLCDTARSELTSYREYVNQVEEAWNKVYDAAYRALQMSKQAAAAAGKDVSYSGGSSSGSGTQGVFSPEKSPEKKPNSSTDKTVSVQLYASPGGGAMGNPIKLKKGQFSTPAMYREDADKDADKWPYYYYLNTNNNLDGYIDKKTQEALMSLDTGGYTGDWSGGSGRLAMLHSKELVLNAKDTENILDTVNTIRDLGSVTSSIGSAIINTIKAMVMEALGIKAGVNYNTQQANTSTNNTFEIYAEFPNANDVTSIREAILSLPNLASQYTSQNKK